MVVCAVSWIMTGQVLAAFCAALAVVLVSLQSVQAQNEINSKLNSGASCIRSCMLHDKRCMNNDNILYVIKFIAFLYLYLQGSVSLRVRSLSWKVKASTFPY